jgi:hypothetical protein
VQSVVGDYDIDADEEAEEEEREIQRQDLAEMMKGLQRLGWQSLM